MNRILTKIMIAAAVIFFTYLIALGYALIVINRFEKKAEPYLTGKPESAIHKSVKTESCRIHYFISGESNTETILFLPPAYGDHTVFDQQVKYFSEKYKVITVDLIGHGLSQPEEIKETFDKSSEHIKMILDAEKIAKVHLAGVSAGGLIAQDFSFRYPERTASVAVTGAYDITQDNAELNNFQRKQIFKWLGMAVLPLKFLKVYLAEMSCSKTESQAQFYRSTANFNRSTFRVMSRLSAVMRPGYKPERKYPVALFIGEGDLEIAKRYNREWHQRELSVSLSIIEDAGHNANMDNPLEFNRQLEVFLKNVK
jgi:3-oxoadipate enol-lactonase